MNYNKIQKVHKYKITKCKDGRYSTFVLDSSKPHNRRAVRKTYIKDLEKYLLEFYYRDKQSNKSFAELYKEWVGCVISYNI